MTLPHGGQLASVAKAFELDESNWLDLSTGISPFTYPLPTIPTEVWRELPQQKASLICAAKKYYQTTNVIPTNGSQAVIEHLPSLWDSTNNSASPKENINVYVPSIGYKEHQYAWQKAGFNIVKYQHLPLPKDIKQQSIVIVINPNNPTGELYDKKYLIELYNKLIKFRGWLIVDEAFIDTHPQSCSMIGLSAKEGLFVLRSIGKFFGLAGIRVGFISCANYFHQKIIATLGPWRINGPALYITEILLQDTHWQEKQRHRLNTQSTQMALLLRQFFADKSIKVTSLFITIKSQHAKQLYALLAKQKVYLRLCDENNALRFGIAKDKDFERLRCALKNACSQL